MSKRADGGRRSTCGSRADTWKVHIREARGHDTFCPACGFGLDFPPWVGDSPSDEMCPCCWIQFGYDDHVTGAGAADRRAATYQRWREEWKKAGTPWRGKGRAPPAGWNPVEQLRRVE